MVENTTSALIKIADNLQGMESEAAALQKAHEELSRVREHIVHIHDALDRLSLSKEPYTFEIRHAIISDIRELINA